MTTSGRATSEAIAPSQILLLEPSTSDSQAPQGLRGSGKDVPFILVTSVLGEDSPAELIEQPVSGTFRVSQNGSFLSANPALLQILACPSPQVLGSVKVPTSFVSRSISQSC